MKGTIKSKDEITRLFQSGQRFSAASMLVLSSAAVQRPDSSNNQYGKTRGRVAFIAGKKLGAAPLRSKAKRRLREAAALHGAPWDGYDVVFVARKGAIESKFSKIEADIQRFTKSLDKTNDDNDQSSPVSLDLETASKTSVASIVADSEPEKPKKSATIAIFGFIGNIPKNIALGCITIYRHVISPLFPPSCRYIPTCSEYALEAFRRYGFLRGFGLAVRRIGRCHPWHEGGYDPVP